MYNSFPKVLKSEYIQEMTGKSNKYILSDL